MQGIFSSDTFNVPAVVATGTNGAPAISASTDAFIAMTVTGRGNYGVVGVAPAVPGIGAGLFGFSDFNIGVQGVAGSSGGAGVVGTGPNAGVVAFNSNNTNAAYLASGCCAAWFTGGVTVTG